MRRPRRPGARWRRERRRSPRSLRRILVIKLGALGDFVQAMGPAAAIRAHHRDAEITLLTTAPYAALARAAPYFDRVWVDERPGLARPLALLRLRRRLREGGFGRVYDLQTSDRSSFYFRLMAPGPRPEWSGIARGASHRHANAARDRMHTLDRQAEQLRLAGIARCRAARSVLGGGRPRPLPAAAAHPAAGAGWGGAPAGEALAGRELRPARRARRRGRRRAGDRRRQRRAAARRGHRRRGQERARPHRPTGFGDVVALGRVALHAVGNDTGPMHLLVAGGAAATVLYSASSDPALTAPRGPRVTILRRDDLAALEVEEVAATLPFG